jgi:hypothetical protein
LAAGSPRTPCARSRPMRLISQRGATAAPAGTAGDPHGRGGAAPPKTDRSKGSAGAELEPSGTRVTPPGSLGHSRHAPTGSDSPHDQPRLRQGLGNWFSSRHGVECHERLPRTPYRCRKLQADNADVGDEDASRVLRWPVPGPRLTHPRIGTAFLVTTRSREELALQRSVLIRDLTPSDRDRPLRAAAAPCPFAFSC